MRTISCVRWIANAAARLAGPHGAVTRQAKEAGCSRQSVYDHAEKVKAAVEAMPPAPAPRAKSCGVAVLTSVAASLVQVLAGDA